MNCVRALTSIRLTHAELFIVHQCTSHKSDPGRIQHCSFAADTEYACVLCSSEMGSMLLNIANDLHKVTY